MSVEANKDPVVVQEPQASRFVIKVDGELAGFANYVDHDDVRNFNHTVVLPEYRGQGLSKPLVKEALDATRAAHMRVIPTCSAVEGFIVKNPEYRDLLA